MRSNIRSFKNEGDEHTLSAGEDVSFNHSRLTVKNQIPAMALFAIRISRDFGRHGLGRYC